MSLFMDSLTRSSLIVAARLVERLKTLLVATAIAFCLPASAWAALVEYHIHFEPSVSSAAVGYTLHIGMASGDYSNDFDLGSPPAEGGTVIYAVDLEDSVDLYIALQAYDAAGVASGYSNEMRIAAVIPAPPAPEPIPEPEPEPEPEPTPVPPPEPEPDPEPTPEPPPEPEPAPEPEPTADPGLISDSSVALATIGDGQILSLSGSFEMSLLTIDSLAAGNDLRPVRCDLDGDGDQDLVIGFGPGSGGEVAVLYLEDGIVVAARSITTANSRYRANPSAVTNPGCGDMDGDGLAEIVVGFSADYPRKVQIFDDESTGFAPMRGRVLSNQGFMRVQKKRDRAVALYPAIGDIDGDGRGELIIGSDPGSQMGLAIRDDARANFRKHPSVDGRRGSIYPVPGNVSGTDWMRKPALGDLDGDGYDEIVVSFGRGSAGRILILEDARSGYVRSGSPDNRYVIAGRSNYRSIDGETQVALGDIDDDGVAEIVVGFRRSSKHEVQIFDDLLENNVPMNDAEGFISVDGFDVSMFPSPAR